MCGIAGIWHHDKRRVDSHALRRMTRALTHRGPDAEGHHEEPGIGLGHRRLAIVDLNGGQQPLCNEDGSVWVVFNGEIFNYVELREDLLKRGHEFKTQSDTEVLVHLYEERGLDFVDELNGQFAIALWDTRQRRLVLVRDRLGIRPLFLARLPDGTLLFASEMKALFAHGGLKPEIDPIAAGQMARLWVSIPPRTSFKSVEELPCARMLVLEGERRKEHTYWRHQFPGTNDYEQRPLTHWKERVRELLQDAVRLQLRADVPVAAYLSGGLDSSILTSLVKRYHDANLTTFSVGFADARFDERAYQQAMVRYLETDHRELQVSTADIGNAFADAVWLAERPMMRTAPAPLLRLAGLVRESGIKVVLSGEGADEVFGGYNLFKEEKVRRFWARSPSSAWRPKLLSGLYGYIARDQKSDAFWQGFFRNGLLDTSDPYYSHRTRWNNSRHSSRFFAAEFRAQMQTEEELAAELHAYLGPVDPRWHPLCRAQYLELMLFMSCYLLSTQGDRMMMGHSIEGRVPFLDHRLVELAACIPPKYKIRGLNEKYILKQTFGDLLPELVTHRPKQPYRAPIAACFGAGANNFGSHLLAAGPLEHARIADPASVDKLLQKAAVPGARLCERDEMALATITSFQLLHHFFVADFRSNRLQIAA